MESLVAMLAVVTLGGVAVFAYLSAKKTDKRFKSDTPPSTLAKDGPDSRKNNARTMPDE